PNRTHRDPPAAGQHGQVATAAAVHLLETLVARLVKVGGDHVATHHLDDRRGGRVASRDHDAGHQIALGEHADQLFAVEDGDGTHLRVGHAAQYLEDRLAGLRGEEGPGPPDLVEGMQGPASPRPADRPSPPGAKTAAATAYIRARIAEKENPRKQIA